MRQIGLPCLALLLSVLVAPAPAAAQLPPQPGAEELLSESFPGPSYSPYAGGDFPSHVLWGDTHLHTEASMDAGAFGNRLGLTDDAYRVRARSRRSPPRAAGVPARLSRPLDFLVVADHSDNMGFFPRPARRATQDMRLSDPRRARDWYERIQQAGEGPASCPGADRALLAG